MQIEKGRISSPQLIFIVATFTIGSSVLLPPGAILGRYSWMASILGLVEGLLFGALYVTLSARFSGATFHAVLETVFGRWAGRIVLALWLWFPFHLGALVLSNFHMFLTTIIPGTPDFVFATLIAIVCCSAVRNGIEVMARCAQVLLTLTILFFSITLFLSVPIMDLKNMLPVFDIPPKELLLAAHNAASFPFAESVVFLMILPYVQTESQRSWGLAKGIAAAGLVLVMKNLRNALVLGETMKHTTYPSFEAVRLIDAADILERLEILTANDFMTMGFMKITVLLYVSVTGISHLAKLRSYLPLVWPVGSLMVILSLANFPNIIANDAFIQSAYPLYAVLFELLIPLVTLITAVVRGKSKASIPIESQEH